MSGNQSITDNPPKTLFSSLEREIKCFLSTLCVEMSNLVKRARSRPPGQKAVSKKEMFENGY